MLNGVESNDLNSELLHQYLLQNHLYAALDFVCPNHSSRSIGEVLRRGLDEPPHYQDCCLPWSHVYFDFALVCSFLTVQEFRYHHIIDHKYVNHMTAIDSQDLSGSWPRNWSHH